MANIVNSAMLLGQVVHCGSVTLIVLGTSTAFSERLRGMIRTHLRTQVSESERNYKKLLHESRIYQLFLYFYTLHTVYYQH